MVQLARSKYRRNGEHISSAAGSLVQNNSLICLNFNFSISTQAYSANNKKRPTGGGQDPASARAARRGCVEVRTATPILHGAQPDHSETAARMLPAHVLSNDCHRAVDISVCRSQEPQRVQRSRLHETHARWRFLSSQQQQILRKPVRGFLGFFLMDFSQFFGFFRVNIKESSIQKLGSVCRRIYRIFSHAYFHHREIFDAFEVRQLSFLFN